MILLNRKSMLTEILTDKHNVVNVACAWVIMFFNFVSTMMGMVDAATKVITLISVSLLCVYNAIRVYRKWKNKSREWD